MSTQTPIYWPLSIKALFDIIESIVYNICQFFTVIYKPKQFETPDIKRFTDKPTVVRPTFINYSRLPIELHPYSRKIQKKRKFKPKILPQEIPTEENSLTVIFLSGPC